MNLLNWIEDKLDKITPAIEITGLTVSKFNSEDFHSLMTRLISENKFKLRSKNDSSYVFCIKGRTIGELSQAKVLFGKKALPDMYRSFKSRYKCILLDDGTIKISSFEHIAGLEKEREVLRQILSERLDILLKQIDKSSYIKSKIRISPDSFEQSKKERVISKISFLTWLLVFLVLGIVVSLSANVISSYLSN